MEEAPPKMKPRYVCVGCQGATCPRCRGRGWVREFLVRLERTNLLVEAVAKNLIQKKIAAVGKEEWGRRAATENLTVGQFTELEVWQATGPVKYGFMGLTKEVIDALATLVGFELPPVFMEDRPKLNLVG
jgi:hypothetical protein